MAPDITSAETRSGTLKWRRNKARQKVIVTGPNPNYTPGSDDPKKKHQERTRPLMSKNAIKLKIKVLESKIKRLRLEYQVHLATGEGGEYRIEGDQLIRIEGDQLIRIDEASDEVGLKL